MNMQDLLKQKITIPSIQRDFAMGRTDTRSRDIRQNFIRKLLNAVYNGAPLHLDFVYGLTQGDILLPLDGQQRLTMLYLLAWFCGADIREWDFDYESRRSTEFFMEGLKKHPRSETSLKPSSEICGATWFSPAWKLDPSVSGMLCVLDDMADIKSELKSAHTPDFATISFERFDIGSSCASDEYGNIFLKMNARGLPLTSWENLKAVLDFHAPDDKWKENVGLWQGKIWNMIRRWQEKIWGMMPASESDFAHKIEWLNIAMEKIVRIFATSFLYEQNTKEIKYGVSTFQLGFVVSEHKDFYQQCSRCFEKLPEISVNWSATRCENRLWGGDGSDDFKTWLFDRREPSLASQLRLIFLTAECADERKVRALLNLLDNSSFSVEKYRTVMDSGLKLLRDGEWPSAESGFNVHQLGDERFKADFPDDYIVNLEKNPLVWRGSLSFLHPQGEKPSLQDLNSRLSLLNDNIQNRWQDLYFTLLFCMPYVDVDKVPEQICIPRQETLLWAKEIFSNQKHERLHHALAMFYGGAKFEAGNARTWLIHLKSLIERNMFPEYLRYIKFVRGWNYCIKNENLSGVAIRLAWSHSELENLKKINKDFLLAVEIPYLGFFPVEGTDCYYQVADINDDHSWYESDQPNLYRKEQNERGEKRFVKVQTL